MCHGVDMIPSCELLFSPGSCVCWELSSGASLKFCPDTGKFCEGEKGMKSLWRPCRIYECSFCHHCLSDGVGLRVIPLGSLWCQLCQCFVSVQELRVAVCQEVAVNCLFTWGDQQTEWQCQGAPARSSECPVAFSGP